MCIIVCSAASQSQDDKSAMTSFAICWPRPGLPRYFAASYFCFVQREAWFHSLSNIHQDEKIDLCRWWFSTPLSYPFDVVLCWPCVQSFDRCGRYNITNDRLRTKIFLNLPQRYHGRTTRIARTAPCCNPSLSDLWRLTPSFICTQKCLLLSALLSWMKWRIWTNAGLVYNFFRTLDSTNRVSESMVMVLRFG